MKTRPAVDLQKVGMNREPEVASPLRTGSKDLAASGKL